MQDSLEDYLRISKNKKDISQKLSPQVSFTAQKKKECEARALKIVQFLIDGKLRKEALFECLKHINPSHYQDVVEERAITKLCGYCLCGKTIPEMPKKQYHISTKANKVYDITDRKNYCSNICYKSSIHLKAQIETSPLWLRKPEDAPKFLLLPSCQKGVPGEEIDQGIVKPVRDESVFTSVSMFTEASLDEVISNEIKTNKKTQIREAVGNKTRSAMIPITEDDEEENNDSQEQLLNSNSEQIDCANKAVETKPINRDERDNKSESQDRELNVVTKSDTKRKVQKKKTVSVDVLSQIHKNMKAWITLETFIYLHGENKVKSILNETTLGDYFEKLKVADLEASQQIRYLNICRKLKLKEIADEKFDRSVNEGKLKPVPDYKQLKEESKSMDLKVRAFYSRSLHEQEDCNFPSQKKQNEAVGEEEVEPVLPLVDTFSQNVLRKKIYLDSVNRTLQMLLPLLDLNERYILEDVQSLVKTFSLQAHNTVFKPLIWTVIGVVLLKILSIKSEELRTQLESRKNKDYIELLLKPFRNSTHFIEDILKTLNNVEAFVEHYVTTND